MRTGFALQRATQLYRGYIITNRLWTKTLFPGANGSSVSPTKLAHRRRHCVINQTRRRYSAMENLRFLGYVANITLNQHLVHKFLPDLSCRHSLISSDKYRASHGLWRKPLHRRDLCLFIGLDLEVKLVVDGHLVSSQNVNRPVNSSTSQLIHTPCMSRRNSVVL